MPSFSLVFLAISEVLSIISSGFLILIFIFKKNSRKYAFKLSLPLFIYDFLVGFSIVIPTFFLLFSPDFTISVEMCYLEGAIRSFASMGECMATVNITLTLYTLIILREPVQKNPLKYFAIFNIVPPLLCAIIPIFFQRYSYVLPFPQILCALNFNGNLDRDYLGIVLRILLYYIPVFTTFIFDIYAVIRILFYFRRNKHDIYNQGYIRMIIFYPIVLFISWISLIVKRISEGFDPNILDWFNNFDLSLMILNGFFNAIVYGFVSINALQYINITNNQQDQNIDESQLLSQSQSNQTSNLHENDLDNKLFFKNSDEEKSSSPFVII